MVKRPQEDNGNWLNPLMPVVAKFTKYLLHSDSSRYRWPVASCLTAVGFLSAWAGEVDMQMLAELQSELPDVPVTAEIVEGSNKLVSYFRGSDSQRRKKPHTCHV